MLFIEGWNKLKSQISPGVLKCWRKFYFCSLLEPLGKSRRQTWNSWVFLPSQQLYWRFIFIPRYNNSFPWEILVPNVNALLEYILLWSRKFTLRQDFLDMWGHHHISAETTVVETMHCNCYKSKHWPLKSLFTVPYLKCYIFKIGVSEKLAGDSISKDTITTKESITHP